MNPHRFKDLTARYAKLRVAVVGDFSLDRYLEIDPALAEISIETGLPVHNVVNVRAQPGSAGTILNNLCALGIGRILPVGFCGVDGEGFELIESLRTRPGVALDHFQQTPQRCTFTYCKPLVVKPGKPPRELSRLDRKNWSPTPGDVQNRTIESLYAIAGDLDALILMDQVDVAGTGVITPGVLEAVQTISRMHRQLPILADSRRGLRGYPKVIFKMNGAELAALTGRRSVPAPGPAAALAARIAEQNQQPVFVSLAKHGMVGAEASGQTAHVLAWPVKGPIDIVGAGDAVTANLTAALAAGASVVEAMHLANAAASIVIHQLGTTGTASVPALAQRLRIKSQRTVAPGKTISRSSQTPRRPRVPAG